MTECSPPVPTPGGGAVKELDGRASTSTVDMRDRRVGRLHDPGRLLAAASVRPCPCGGGLKGLVDFFGVDAQDAVAEPVAGEFAGRDLSTDRGDADAETVRRVLEGFEAQRAGRGGCSLLVTHAHPKPTGSCSWTTSRWGDLIPARGSYSLVVRWLTSAAPNRSARAWSRTSVGRW